MPWSPERKAAWLAKVKQTNYKPAGGTSPWPAQGSKGPARGAFVTSEEARAVQAHATPERIYEKAVSADLAHRTKVDIMLDPAQPAAARVSAANSVEDRYYGKAVTRSADTPEKVEDFQVLDASKMTPEQRFHLREVLTALPAPSNVEDDLYDD